MSQQYRPGSATGQFVTNAEFRAELLRSKQAQERPHPNVIWVALAAEPDKIVPNMEVLADGTNWDPGSIGVAGKYRRNAANTAWELIEATVVAAGLAAHLADTTDAHDASAISILDTAGDFTATDVEGALAELQADHETDAQNLADHIADTTDAHDASAISNVPAGNIAATTVQAAIDELDAEKQPLDADLTSWAGVTRAAGFDTFAATPNSANLKALVTDETGSGGALVFATGPTITGAGLVSAATLSKANADVAGFDLAFEYNSATASANRTVTWDVNNASRGINMSGNLIVSAAADVSGINSGDETLATIGTKLDSAAAKTPLVDADVIITLDSAASNAVKKWSFLNVKANLKTYFDTLYQPLAAALTSWASVTRAAGFDTWAATPTSANLRSLVTDESGTGALLFQSGDLGTPTAGIATNLTGTASGLTAGIASTVSVANEASDTTCFPLFGTAASGDLQPKTNTNITFNSSTGVFTSASLVATTADINGGTVDGATVGASSASTVKATTLETTGTVGLGAAPPSISGVQLSLGITGATTAYGFLNTGVVQSGVTSSASYFSTNASTAAASFTCSNFYHYRAQQATLGASSAVTSQYGFAVDSSLTSGTSNYGFHSNIAAAANRWNFFALGTANNAFNGAVRVGSTTAPVNTLDVTGSFGRGAPVTKTGDFTVAATENWLIVNKGSSPCTVTLPAASSFTGREIMIKVITAHTVVSASSNVVPQVGGAAGTAILAAVDGAWACLVSNGTNWEIMQS